MVDGIRPVSGRRPFVGPLEAIFRHPFMTVLPLLLVIGGAVGLGLDRSPNYTASANLGVSLVNTNAEFLQQQILGNQLLASDYARAIDTPEVIRAVSRSTRVAPRKVEANLTASPIFGSTIIRVEAKTHARGGSIALANAGSVALTNYIGKVSLDTDSKRQLSQYRQSALRVAQAQSRLYRLQGTKATPARIRKASADVQTELVQAANLANVYRINQENAPPRNRARILTVAGDARSDFKSVLQQLILIGAVAGAVLGVTFALARANRPLLRHARR